MWEYKAAHESPNHWIYSRFPLNWMKFSRIHFVVFKWLISFCVSLYLLVKNTAQNLYLGEWTRELATAQGFLINVTVPKPVQKKINFIPKQIKTSGQTTSMGKSNKLERKIQITCLESYLNHRPPQLRTRVFPI